MTVSTEDGNRQNLFAIEPKMYIDEGSIPHNEKAERLNGRLAMLGVIAAIGAYAVTGQLIPGIFYLPLLKIMKKIFALSTASILAATPALAGPYVNVEANQKFDTGDYTSTLTEAHVGWETKLGKSSKFYIQGGPAKSNSWTMGTTSLLLLEKWASSLH